VTGAANVYLVYAESVWRACLRHLSLRDACWPVRVAGLRCSVWKGIYLLQVCLRTVAVGLRTSFAFAGTPWVWTGLLAADCAAAGLRVLLRHADVYLPFSVLRSSPLYAISAVRHSHLVIIRCLFVHRVSSRMVGHECMRCGYLRTTSYVPAFSRCGFAWDLRRFKLFC
jgi:hypothetical protein